MSKREDTHYRRPLAAILARRLKEPRRFIQAVTILSREFGDGAFCRSAAANTVSRRFVVGSGASGGGLGSARAGGWAATNSRGNGRLSPA